MRRCYTSLQADSNLSGHLCRPNSALLSPRFPRLVELWEIFENLGADGIGDSSS